MDFLIVDNDPVSLRLVENCLKKEGHKVVSAFDGLSALDILKKYTPEFIFIDYVMPNIDGGTLCRIIKKEQKLKDTFIVILSAVAAEEWTDCCDCGADAYIVKAPFNIMRDYILGVINDRQSARKWCSSGRVIGIEKVVPRVITTELLTSKKHYGCLLNQMSEGILELNSEKRIVYANPSALGILNKLEYEILGLAVQDLFSDDQKTLIHNITHKMSQDIYEHTEDRIILYENKYLSLKSARLEGSVNHSLLLIGDITDIKNSQLSLKEANNFLSSILDSSRSYSIISTDLNQNIIFWNKGAEKMFGYTAEEVVGKKKITILYPRAFDNTLTKPFRKTIVEEKSTLSFETREVTKTGGELWVKIHMSPRIDKSGNVVGILGIGENITELKEIEEEKEELQNQVLHARKLESIGTLAGGIAHDFNNLLMEIQGNISIANLKAEKQDPVKDNLVNIEQCVIKGANLTDRLLNLAKGAKGPVSSKDLNSIIKKTVKLFKKEKNGIDIELNLAENLWKVDLNESQMNQVFLNLFENAFEAMEGKGRTTVTTQNQILNEQYVKPHKLSAGKYVEIEVKDTGIGMDRQTLEKIFDPFFTTRTRVEKGAGLGLATVYVTVKNHRGMIKVKSKPGEGAAFKIYLPASRNSQGKVE